MLECKSMDILDAPGHVLAGYCSLRPMPDLEFDLLKVSQYILFFVVFLSSA